MKLGFQIGHWMKDSMVGGCDLYPHDVIERLKEAETWGCESVWLPESYFAEAFTFMSWIGANTGMTVGSAVIPMQARTPVNCAQSALTLDYLTRGRVMLGLGVTGINVAEGWYGQRFDKPVARTREYFKVMRAVLEGERPNNADGTYYRLPVENGVGSGKAIKSPTKPYRKDLPVLLGAIGPKKMALAGEIADGWMPALYIPDQAKHYRSLLEEGFARPGARRTWKDFIMPGPVSVVIDDDIERAADQIRQSVLYLIGVMGSAERNFQLELFAGGKFEAEARKARALFMEGKQAEAAASIPLAMVDAISLIGPKARIRDNLQRWTSSEITHLIVRGKFEALRFIAEIGNFS